MSEAKRPLLFTPYRLRELELANRLVVAPMCQYSADDGSANDWHMMHLGTLANSGAGLVIIEATAVQRDGRIGHGCIGLYKDENETALGKVLEACRRRGTAKIGIQLAHAGRKASTKRPWEGKTMHDPVAPGDAWSMKSSSATPLTPDNPTPRAMTLDEIKELRADFVSAVKRCDRLDLDMIEIHAAHGYLINQFLSPYVNKRTDQYGGSFENRTRLLREVFQDMRAAWPAHKPMGVRLSCIEWIDPQHEQWTLDDTVALTEVLKGLGCDYIDCSSGGNDPKARVVVGPGYQVPFAEAVRKKAGIPTMAVGMITEPQQAEEILQSGKADLIAIARAFLDDPHWGWHAAYALGGEVQLPPQYQRVGIKLWRPERKSSA